jgi:hypothetical protein
LPRSGSTAWVATLLGRTTGGVTLDHEQLGQRRILDRAVGELARQRRVLERRLASGQVTRLARGLAGALSLDGLHDHRTRLTRVLLEELAQAGVDDRLHEAGYAGVAELRLRLTLELWVAELDGDDRGQPLTHVLSGEVVLFVFEQAVVAGVLVERARERGAEAAHV